MQFEYTLAVGRVFAEAARWSSGADEAPLDLPELLLALLSEEESRAAAILTSSGVDAASIQQRWPALRQIASPPERRSSDLSLSLHAALAEAHSRLCDLPQPLSLATEHLLLGLLAVPSETADWLRSHALDSNALQAKIFRWEGATPGPWEIADCGLRIADCKENAESEVSNTERSASAICSPAGGLAANHSALRTPHSALPTHSALRTPHSALPPTLRLLDAAANRAREGLRVIEDYVRFVLDDGHLTGELKAVRHALAAVLAHFPNVDLLASRDTLADVGTRLTTAREQTRADLVEVVTANFKRLEESLRSLEEHAKTIDAALAAQLEQLRYRVYTLERAVGITADSLARLADARLYVLLDGRESPAAFEKLARSLITAGVHVIQLRDKRLNDRELLGRARLLRELIRVQPAAPLFIMNDRPDLAALAEADGVHVGQEELSVKDARSIVGPRALIGVSTHSLEQARRAVLDGANYIGVGPTFPSGTKQFAAFTGLDLLRAVAVEIRLPAFAIGGITLANLPSVLATGMTRIAVSGAITTNADPAKAAAAFRESL